MKKQLSTERFSFISEENKNFILAFDEEIRELGYDSGGSIGDGYCWGKFMIIYSKTGVKSKKVIARIYIRENEIVLRLFLNKIDDHRKFIEEAPEYIKSVFTGEHGRCKHCKNQKGDDCRFRKTYTIDGGVIEMCNGMTFEFWEPTKEKLPDYLELLGEFYSRKKSALGKDLNNSKN
jgi:hypothetical protein